MMSDSENNIQFNYLYRDAANFKVFGHEIFSNPERLELKLIDEEIRKSIIDGLFFDPDFCGIKRLKHDDWISKLDHTWNEYEFVESTIDNPTVNFSVKEFLLLLSMIPKY